MFYWLKKTSSQWISSFIIFCHPPPPNPPPSPPPPPPLPPPESWQTTSTAQLTSDNMSLINTNSSVSLLSSSITPTPSPVLIPLPSSYASCITFLVFSSITSHFTDSYSYSSQSACPVPVLRPTPVFMQSFFKSSSYFSSTLFHK